MNPQVNSAIQSALIIAGVLVAKYGILTASEWAIISGPMATLLGVLWNFLDARDHAALRDDYRFLREAVRPSSETLSAAKTIHAPVRPSVGSPPASVPVNGAPSSDPSSKPEIQS